MVSRGAILLLSQISRKVSIALVSLVAYCTLISLIIFILDGLEFFGFYALWMTFFVLSAPMFIIAGVVVSFILSRVKMKPIVNGFIFTLVGGFLIIPYSAYIFDFSLEVFWNYFLFGALAGLVFYLVQVLFEKLIFRKEILQ